MYGIGEPRDEIMATYRRIGKHGILVDLGYWERRRGGRYHGFHKVVVDEIHPVEMLEKIGERPSARLDDLVVCTHPIHSGDEIIVAGMSAKSAATHGLASESWELAAIKKLQKVTNRTIVYRPKPSWTGARPLPGAEFQDGNAIPIEEALKRAHAVVTHHSNVGVDAVVAGVRLYTETGAAKAMSQPNIEGVENGLVPSYDRRMSWMRALAYCQWTVKEMKSGKPWAFMAQAGLLS